MIRRVQPPPPEPLPVGKSRTVYFPNGTGTPTRSRRKVLWSGVLALVGAAFAVWLMARLPQYLYWSMAFPKAAGVGCGFLLATVTVGATLLALRDVWSGHGDG